MFPDRLRPTPRQYVRITQFALVALSFIIVTGAAVRLTGSGLGCTDWPLCEKGHAVAPLEFQPMVEQINRFITFLVSAAVAIAVLGSMRRIPRRRDLTRWSWFLVGGVVAQIVIGAFVTLSELKYSMVSLHFLVSMVLVWAAVVLMYKAADPELDRPEVIDGTVPAPRRPWLVEGKVLAALGAIVLFSGAMVTSAGKHPGALRNHDGVEYAVKRLPFDISSVTRVHSILVWVLCAATIATAVRLRRRSPQMLAVCTQLLGVVVAQGALGYIQYFSGVPALMVGFHVAGATLVWVMTLRVGFVSAGAPSVIDAAGESMAHHDRPSGATSGPTAAV